MPKHEKLLNCPFCKSKGHLGECTNASNGKVRYAICCDTYGCRLYSMPLWSQCFTTVDEATAAWNTRDGEVQKC